MQQAREMRMVLRVVMLLLFAISSQSFQRNGLCGAFLTVPSCCRQTIRRKKVAVCGAVGNANRQDMSEAFGDLSVGREYEPEAIRRYFAKNPGTKALPLYVCIYLLVEKQLGYIFGLWRSCSGQSVCDWLMNTTIQGKVREQVVLLLLWYLYLNQKTRTVQKGPILYGNIFFSSPNVRWDHCHHR